MDQYPVLKRMADAIYGEVLLCRDSATFDIVAVKKIHMHRAVQRLSGVNTNAVLHEDVRFELEVNHRVQLAGGHPHICRLRHDFTYDHLDATSKVPQPILAMVFDYCPHGELLTTLSEAKQFPEIVALRYVAQIGQAIDFLHHLHIAHRDISLENILLDGNYRAKLCDFGLACDVHTVQTSPVGKLLYMAPEVLAGEEYSPSQADIWSLGVALFTMVVGHYPFHEASMHDPFYNVHARVGIACLLRTHSVGYLSVELQNLLAKLLHVNPHERLQCHQVLAHPLIEPFVDDDFDTTSFSTVSLDNDSRVVVDSPKSDSAGNVHEPHKYQGSHIRLKKSPPSLAFQSPGKPAPPVIPADMDSLQLDEKLLAVPPHRSTHTALSQSSVGPSTKGSFKLFWKQKVQAWRHRWRGKV